MNIIVYEITFFDIKSTKATQYGFCMDMGNGTVNREEFDQQLQTILQTDRWIIDGNYQRTLPLRFEACTDVFFLDLSLNECLEGAASWVGTVREDMPWI